MSWEEREAVRDVISEKIEQALADNERAEEQETVVKSMGGAVVRHRCTHCPISFTDQASLRDHLERKHRVRSSAGVKVSSVKRQGVSIVKNESPASDESDPDDPLSTTPKMKKKKRSLLKQQLSRSADHGPRVKVLGNRTSNAILAGPDDSAGSGNTCPLCHKEFPSNGPMKRHFEDIHQPGEFPCKGCHKVFSSKNKVSSHYSRNCKRRTM